MTDYKSKYIKYKNKYLKLKGGADIASSSKCDILDTGSDEEILSSHIKYHLYCLKDAYSMNPGGLDIVVYYMPDRSKNKWITANFISENKIRTINGDEYNINEFDNEYILSERLVNVFFKIFIDFHHVWKKNNSRAYNLMFEIKNEIKDGKSINIKDLKYRIELEIGKEDMDKITKESQPPKPSPNKSGTCTIL